MFIATGPASSSLFLSPVRGGMDALGQGHAAPMGLGLSDLALACYKHVDPNGAGIPIPHVKVSL